jgi:hypothetical protein
MGLAQLSMKTVALEVIRRRLQTKAQFILAGFESEMRIALAGNGLP